MSRIHAFSVAAALTVAAGTSQAAGIGPVDDSVDAANPRGGATATFQPTRLSHDLSRALVATGVMPLENPSGLITRFGFLNNGAMTAEDIAAGDTPATRTEPDENTYLALGFNPGGPTAGYNYGRHFLFQGHENQGDLAYITRINLDVHDPRHRITLLTPVGTDGLTHFNAIDGSVWNPFTRTLLFTQEDGGPILQLPVTWPPRLTTLGGLLGIKGYEGIHPDGLGNLYLAEDIGGASLPSGARQPNSFVYRFVPYNKADLLRGGKLQALQVSIDGSPITFHAGDLEGDILSEAQLELHTAATSWPITWITVHDSGPLAAGDPQPADFDANALAKAAGATPFKRPENLQFQPGTEFRKMFFDETGDTSATPGAVPELAARGSWGSIFEVNLAKSQISIFVLGDAEHASFDNLSFADAHTLIAAEDRGDGLHTQLDTLDSIWGFSTTRGVPVRWVALGEDPVAALTGDNEPTGTHVSNGATNVGQLLGRFSSLPRARGFFTQQHGRNNVWEIFSGE